MRVIRECLAGIAAGLQFGVVLRAWNQLPAQVPTHFDASGAADAWGPRSSLLVVPTIGVLLYLLLTALSFFPQHFNYPVKVTNRNRARLHELGVSMLGWLKAEVAWTLAYVTWSGVQVSTGKSEGLGFGFLPVMLATVGGTLWVFIGQMKQAGDPAGK
jgi:hypothetical protein